MTKLQLGAPRHSTLVRYLRHRSPLYLHVKLFVLTSLVSLVVARPVSRTVEAAAEEVAGQRRRHRAVGLVRKRVSSDTEPIWRRWRHRLKDLAGVRALVAQSSGDHVRYPEIGKEATVRTSAFKASPEAGFLAARLKQVAQSLPAYLGAPHSSIPASQAPVLAVGGSGGGFRAMVSYAAFLHHLQSSGPHPLWPLISYTAGVSGSCWTLASLYTHANLSTSALLRHQLALTSEETHPMSLAAFDRVARSRRGSYFLFGPLMRKMAEGARGGGVMDLYATLNTSFLLLPRCSGSRNAEAPTQATAGLSREAMAWSRVYRRFDMERGMAPLPVLTAASVAKGAEEGSTDAASGASAPPSSKVIKSKVHWYEATPLEFGSSDVHRRDGHAGSFIPTWSFGRPFAAGRSLASTGEQSLSLLVGHCTSAPAGPLTGYITALLSTLPSHTAVSWLLRKLNDFLMWKTWRRRWGNPIRSSAEWNPFYGMQRDFARKLKLADAGISNNLPAHVFYGSSSSRRADVFIGFDASSDVGSWKSLQRVQDFAQDRGLRFVFAPEEYGDRGLIRWFRKQQQQHVAGQATRVELGDFLDTMRRVEDRDDAWPSNTPCVVLDGYDCESTSDSTQPRLVYIYVPLLLPGSASKGEDWSFASVYNLVWTRSETQRVIDAVHQQLTAGAGDFDEKARRVMARVAARFHTNRIDA